MFTEKIQSSLLTGRLGVVGVLGVPVEMVNGVQTVPESNRVLKLEIEALRVRNLDVRT